MATTTRPHTTPSPTRLRLAHASVCPHTGGPCLPALALLENLEPGLDLARTAGVVADDFSLTGTVEAATCTRPCTLAFHAAFDVVHVFGDVDREMALSQIGQWTDGPWAGSPEGASAATIAQRISAAAH